LGLFAGLLGAAAGQGAGRLLGLVGGLGHAGLGQVGDGLDPLQAFLQGTGLGGDLFLPLGQCATVELPRPAVALFAVVAFALALTGPARAFLALAFGLRALLAFLTLLAVLALGPFALLAVLALALRALLAVLLLRGVLLLGLFLLVGVLLLGLLAGRVAL